jgi:hypothetical protein
VLEYLPIAAAANRDGLDTPREVADQGKTFHRERGRDIVSTHPSIDLRKKRALMEERE